MLNQLISKIEVMVLTDYLVYAFVNITKSNIQTQWVFQIINLVP